MADAIYRNLIGAIWIGWVAYWAIAARGMKATQRREAPLSRAMFAIPVVIAVVMLSLRDFPGAILHARFLPATLATYCIGVGVLLGGLLFSVWARVHLGRNWSGTVTLKQDHELIRSGPYRFVRHPIYTGILFGCIGSAIARGEWRGVLAVAIFLAAVWRKLKLEEQFLGEHFGEAYARFRAEVPALIPWLL